MHLICAEKEFKNCRTDGYSWRNIQPIIGQPPIATKDGREVDYKRVDLE